MRRKIETKRLILRSFESQDLNALVKYAGDIDVARATGQLPHPYTKADAQSWLNYNLQQSSAAAKSYIYAIASPENALIGCISLMPTNDDKQAENWNLGYWLGQAHWHKGYMREACAALLIEARQTLAPTNICATVFTDNPRSAAILQHLGFTLTAQVSEFCVARGHNVEAHKLTLSLEAHHA